MVPTTSEELGTYFMDVDSTNLYFPSTQHELSSDFYYDGASVVEDDYSHYNINLWNFWDPSFYQWSWTKIFHHYSRWIIKVLASCGSSFYFIYYFRNPFISHVFWFVSMCSVLHCTLLPLEFSFQDWFDLFVTSQSWLLLFGHRLFFQSVYIRFHVCVL